MKQSKDRKSTSIKKKLMLPMIAMVMVQAFIFIAMIYGVNTIQQLRTSAYTHLEQIASSRRDTLENLMVNSWARMQNYGQVIKQADEVYQTYLQKNETGAKAEPVITEELSQSLIDLMHSSVVTGAYVIFDDRITGTYNNPSVYLRELDPTSVTPGRSGVLVEYGPAKLMKEMGLTLDYGWQPSVSLDASNANHQFYYQPFEAGATYPEAETSDLGYWSPPFRLNENDRDIITFSIPVRDQNGKPYGVVGVEITLDYLRTLLPFREIADDQKGAYLLGVQMEESRTLGSVVTYGPLFQKYVSEGGVDLSDSIYENVHFLQNKGKDTSAICARNEIRLYNTNTPFEDQQWVLLAVVENGDLMYSVHQLENSLLIAFVVAILIGFIGVILISSYFSAPIHSLVACLKKTRPDEPVSLPKVHIAEIDELASSVEKFSADVADSASRLTQVILATDMLLGALEYDPDSETVFCSGRALEVLDFPEDLWNQTSFLKQEFLELVEPMKSRYTVHQEYPLDEIRHMKEKVIRLTNQKGEIHWIAVKEFLMAEKQLAVVHDVSEEIREKMKIEYERDYDMLTRLFNRRSFKKQVAERLAKQKPCIGAMVMWDLDNLKYINDTYGHDYGDKYIFESARVFGTLNTHNALVARMSGDEFLAYVDGFATKQEAEELIKGVHAQLHNTVFWLPDGTTVKLRASGGISWYPENGTVYEDLVKASDYAMYSAKNTVKGEIREYEELSYLRDKVLFSGREDLNRFLDHRLAKFALQPIVDSKTGEVFAYEALMRPQSGALHTVEEVMRIARAQSKLSQIERLTWLGVMETFVEKRAAFGSAKLFVNSVPNTRLSDEDVELIEKGFGEDVSRLVIEIIESEQTDEICMSHKKQIADRWKSGLALDDFGAGYSSESSLLSIDPQFVKIDMGIIRGIDHDVDRQQIVRSILSYTQPRGVKIIAEGIETQAEMEKIIQLGVDYMQGYYLGMPDFEVKDVNNKIKSLIKEKNLKSSQ